MTPRLVLVGMGVDAPAYDDELASIASAAGGEHAYLQLGTPALAAALDRLHADQAGSIVLVGLARGAATKPGVSWLRRAAAHWWRGIDETRRPSVAVAQRLHRWDADQDSAVQQALLSSLIDGAREIDGREPGLTSPAWEDVPGHRHQLLFCRGPRCSAARSDLTALAFAAELDRNGLGDDDVLVTQTGCQFPCNQAPVVVVQPDDVWYGGVGPEAAEVIVQKHLVEGTPPPDCQLRRLR